MITYHTAYLRHHHPKEFVTAYLNNSTDESDIRSGTDLAKYTGIEIKNPKFGSSGGKYTIDGDVIYKGIGSVLFISEKCADTLLRISKTASSFVEMAQQAISNPTVNMRQLKILTKIDFFSKFGKAKKLHEWLVRFETYGGRKTVSKEGLPIGTKFLIDKKLKECVDGFSETAKQYKINSNILVEDIFNIMKDTEYTAQERVVNQLSYVGYIQSEELMHFSIGTVATGKTKLEAFKIDLINGASGWYRFSEELTEPLKGTIILINTEGTIKRGRYTDKIITSYSEIVLDRQTQNNKK